MIRTTPTQSPRRDSDLPQAIGAVEFLTPTKEKTSHSLEPSGPRSQAQSVPATIEHPKAQVTKGSETSFTERRKVTAQATRPPPILKKPRGDSSNQLSKTARILTPTWKTERSELQEEDDDDESAVVSPSVASEPETSQKPPTSQLVIDETLYNDDGKPPPKIPVSRERSPALGTKSGELPSSAKSKSKKSTFVASTVSSKRRPQMSRRKSSNSSGLPPKALTSTPAPRLSAPRVAPTQFSSPRSAIPLPSRAPQGGNGASPPFPPKLEFKSYDAAQFERVPLQSPRPPASRSSRSASPVLSRLPSEHSAQATRDDGITGTQSWLVDVDFKAKFADKLREQAEVQKSFSTVQFNVSTPHTLRRRNVGTQGKGKSVMILGADDEEAEGDSGGSASAIRSSDDEDEDGGESVTAVPAALQKTKSQLTLLLETERIRQREREKRGKGGKERGR